MIRAARGTPLLVTLGTAAIAIVAHLDGCGSTTFLLTIPALLPLYEAMNISRYVLLTIVALSASVMNMLPWGGPVGRASSVIGPSPNEIWTHLLPVQGIAIVLVIIVAAMFGLAESRRSGAGQAAGTVNVSAIAEDFARTQQEERSKLKFTQRTGA